MKHAIKFFLLFSAVLLTTPVFANQNPIPITGNIPGLPNYLAMGTVTNNAPTVGDALAKTPVDAIFKYAGDDGAGDQGKITGTDTIAKTIAQARYIENNSADHHKVMPVLVIYTIDASGGLYNAVNDVTNDQYLQDHYINLIQYCQYMQSQKDSAHPNPATIILNPDFFGAMQQSNSSWSPLQPTTAVNVQQDLTAALKYVGASIQAPAFKNDLTGYIQSINWIIRTFSPDVTFGWQENVWAPGSANWLHTTPNNQVAGVAQTVIDYLNTLGAYQGAYKPDFLAFDRFERDDLYIAQTQWFYRRADWYNYLTFVDDVSRPLSVPAIIWQIPGGHILTNNDQSGLTLDHVATAPDFFFGDANVAQNFPNNIQQQVLYFDLYPGVYGSNIGYVKQYLLNDSDENWSTSELQTAVTNNIVAILWGGGSTTAVAPIGTNGDDGGWLANKVTQYYKNPVPLHH